MFLVLLSLVEVAFLLTLASAGTVDKSKQCPKHIIRHADKVIESPFFGELPGHFRCWYNITAPAGQIAKLQVNEFDFEAAVDFPKINKASSKTCLYNFIEFFDKDDASLGRVCGSKTKQEFSFGEQSIKLLFHTYEGTTQKKGFRMTTKFAPAPKPTRSMDVEELNERAAAQTAATEPKKKAVNRLLGAHYGSMDCGGQMRIKPTEQQKLLKGKLGSGTQGCVWDVSANKVKTMTIETKLQLQPSECVASQFQVVFLEDNNYVSSKWLSGNCTTTHSETITLPPMSKKLRTIVFGFATLKPNVMNKGMEIKLIPQRVTG